MNRYIEQLLRALNHPYTKIAGGVGLAIVGGITLVKSLNRMNANKNKPTETKPNDE